MKFLMKRWWLALLGIIVITISGFVAWAVIIPAPMPEALSALQSNGDVEVTSQNWHVFRPVETKPQTGFIFYPGGRVDARSYAPAMRQIARHGFLVVIVPMPLNLAVLAPSSADSVIAAFPEIKHWAIGGHSLGGSMAANYANAHRQIIDGLVFWASYPASSDNMSDYVGQVASIYGENDGLATLGTIDESRALLPPDTSWVEIMGGNHGQFGWYGDQPGDNDATVSRDAQQEQAVAATLKLLEAIQNAVR